MVHRLLDLLLQSRCHLLDEGHTEEEDLAVDADVVVFTRKVRIIKDHNLFGVILQSRNGLAVLNHQLHLLPKSQLLDPPPRQLPQDLDRYLPQYQRHLAHTAPSPS